MDPKNGTNPVRCVVSLGTGVSEGKEGRGFVPSLARAKRLGKTLTQTETNHLRYADRLREEGIPYYRFNPTTKQDDIGLDEYKKLDALEKHTKDYLDREDVAADIRNCARVVISRRATGDPPSGTVASGAHGTVAEHISDQQ